MQSRAWVVSPHRLVAQAVAEALRSTGAPVEFLAWDVLLEGVGTGVGTHVLVIFDGSERPREVDEIGGFVDATDARVVVVTAAPSAVVWGGLLQGRSVEIVTMTTSINDLAEVVERFLAGEVLMDPEQRKELRAEWLAALDRQNRLGLQLRALSGQQLKVLELLAAGHRVHEVAERMEIADGTVRSHVKALRAKLGARNQLEAVAMFRQATDPASGQELVPRPRRHGNRKSGRGASIGWRP